jgi:hypothetical protein
MRGDEMKRFLLAMLMVAFLFTGCVGVQGNGPVDGNNILKTTDAIYRDIRIVVTDPEVKPMFSQKELEKMAKLEAQYLDVVETLQMYPNDSAAIQQISWLATEVLGIFEQVAYVEKTRPYIAAIRISIQILKNHL